MPVDTQWEDADQTILRHDLSLPWGWNDFAEGVKHGFERVQAREHRVDIIWHIIHEGGGVRTLPPGNPLPLLVNLVRLMPENTGLIVFVNASMLSKAFGSIMTRIRPQIGARARFTDTLEEAHAAIRDARARPPPQS
jgi:hypothetical protein